MPQPPDDDGTVRAAEKIRAYWFARFQAAQGAKDLHTGDVKLHAACVAGERAAWEMYGRWSREWVQRES